MSPLLKKSFILAVALHIVFIVLWSASTYLSIGLGGKTETNENIVDLSLIDDDYTIGEETRIVSRGNEGSLAEEEPEEEKPEEPELQEDPEPQQMTKITENTAEQSVEENIGDERAPTENVDDRGTNFAQAEQGFDISQAVSDLTKEDVVVENLQNKPPKPAEAEDEPKDEASTLRFPIPASDIIAAPNRPSDLKNLANRDEAAPRPQSQNNSDGNQQGSPGQNNDSLDDILGNAMGGENQLQIRDAIIKQLGACYNPPIVPTSEKYRIPVVVTLSAAGEIIKADFEEGYRPKDDYERAKADAALRAAQNPACQRVNGAAGIVQEGHKITIPFS